MGDSGNLTLSIRMQSRVSGSSGDEFALKNGDMDGPETNMTAKGTCMTKKRKGGTVKKRYHVTVRKKGDLDIWTKGDVSFRNKGA